MINNLLKPLLSKPETIHIQRKYETFILIILSCNLTTSSDTFILHLLRQWVASSCSTYSGIGLLHQRHGKIDRSAKNLPGTFFGSHDTYVTTYEAMRISPFTRIEFPSSFFFLVWKDNLRSKNKLRLNFVQWELSLKNLFLYPHHFH